MQTSKNFMPVFVGRPCISTDE